MEWSSRQTAQRWAPSVQGRCGYPSGDSSAGRPTAWQQRGQRPQSARAVSGRDAATGGASGGNHYQSPRAGRRGPRQNCRTTSTNSTNCVACRVWGGAGRVRVMRVEIPRRCCPALPLRWPRSGGAVSVGHPRRERGPARPSASGHPPASPAGTARHAPSRHDRKANSVRTARLAARRGQPPTPLRRSAPILDPGLADSDPWSRRVPSRAAPLGPGPAADPLRSVLARGVTRRI